MEVSSNRNRLVLLFAMVICTILAVLLGGNNKVYAFRVTVKERLIVLILSRIGVN